MTVSIEEAHRRLTAPGQLFEMDEIDIRGVRTRVWKNAPPSLRAIWERTERFADRTYVVYEDERMTYADAHNAVATLAHRLRDHFGVAKGDRVAIAMRNFPEWPVAFWAAAAIGAIVVPLNAWWTGPELEYGLADSGTKVLVADAERWQRVRGLVDTAVVVVRGDGPLRWEDVIGDAEHSTLPDVHIDPEDDGTIFYTSGTTGRPKGALGTQRNITTNLISLLFAAARTALRSGDSPKPASTEQNANLLSVPFFHATGCHSILCANTYAGNKLVLMYRWNPERALELIERERVTSFGGVPTMVWQVLQSPDFDKRDISSVQSIGYGGAPAPPELVRRIEEMFPGRTPSNGYGLTETSSLSTSNGGADYIARPDSVGVPVAVVDVKVVDGELWIKGPNVVKGYWNKPDATAQAFTEGWLRTGDVARIDDEGFVYIVDRAKDMIIRGGENVYCSEVESALFEHPAVMDAAVIGVPHELLGEEVGAVVQLMPGTAAGAADLQAHVAERLAGFKVPAHIWFRDDDLPRNPAGKVLKRELRANLGLA